ncbi:MAG: N-acetylmuramoyl-L-alanine amidase [Bdellovibrionales bacterium]
MKTLLSPNFNDRNSKIALDYIVLHYTGMKDEKSALARLRNPALNVSAHYVLGEAGNLYQLVDESERAWHAGESAWHGIKDMNSASIGIELVNPGHEYGYRPFADAQIISLKTLVREIIERHCMSSKTALLAHSDIAPTRKQDPGELFPWESLALDELGMWPSPNPKDYAPVKKDEVAKTLHMIGYDTTDAEAALLAFQRRYCPENMGKGEDKDTVAKLRALKRQLNE